jgi:hypothetical protein
VGRAFSRQEAWVVGLHEIESEDRR